MCIIIIDEKHLDDTEISLVPAGRHRSKGGTCFFDVFAVKILQKLDNIYASRIVQ
jgi:hypothetical protein